MQNNTGQPQLTPEQQRMTDVLNSTNIKIQKQIGHLSMTNANLAAELEILRQEYDMALKKISKLEKQLPQPASKKDKK